MQKIIGETTSLCPHCLAVIPAVKILEKEDVFIKKTCPDHGEFKTVIWRGDPTYEEWGHGEFSQPLQEKQTKTISGCPKDCGICPEHQADTCTVLMEVTDKCNLSCPTCFAGNRQQSSLNTPDINQLKEMCEAVVAAAGNCPIQLSGGEPTVRDDLPEIVSVAKNAGLGHVQINTNGIRIAKDKVYLKALKDAGTDLIYLQFDGVTDDIYQIIRGTNLFDIKIKAVENCSEVKLGVQLVPTVIPKINDSQLGDILFFAKKYMPVIKGIHFQPVTYSGRYNFCPSNESRITTPEILRLLEIQTSGEIKAHDFQPRRKMDSHCGFSGFYILNDKGKLQATTRFHPDKSTLIENKATCIQSQKKESPTAHVRRFITEKSRFIEPVVQQCSCKTPNGLFNNFYERIQTHYLSISGMPFMDAWTIDLKRLKGCCIHVISADKRLIPFCSYYLTGSQGDNLHKKIQPGPSNYYG
ncbi:MAG: radical SAM protein [Desulfobacterium sp.]|nr:radical SAM protein [Desulfobacterium sp.]MBU4037532.1 radical SAM protein [Pseudomonadota bacterium]